MLKKSLLFPAVVLLSLALFTACQKEGDEGTAGPAGPAGPAGAAAPAAPAGESG